MANTPAFNEKAAPPALMPPEQYRDLLETLLSQGEGYGKAKSVGAYLLRDISFLTETSSGKNETAVDVAVEKRYIVMDLDQYKSEAVRKLVVADTAKNWAGKIVRDRDLKSPDFKGPGLWTNKQAGFEFDYLKKETGNDGSSVWLPNPEAYRVTLTTDKPICMPCTWGQFTVEAGGTVAIRERDVAALGEALQSIRDGDKSIQDALYTVNAKGEPVAKFDIYGMEPKFLENNYDPVALKPATLAMGQAFAPGVSVSGTRTGTPKP